MKYEILEARDNLGNIILNKWQVINIETKYPCGRLYDRPEEAYYELAYLLVAGDLPLPKTNIPEETQLALLKKIIEAFNTLDSDELIEVIHGNRGGFTFHGRGKSEFKLEALDI